MYEVDKNKNPYVTYSFKNENELSNIQDELQKKADESSDVKTLYGNVDRNTVKDSGQYFSHDNELYKQYRMEMANRIHSSLDRLQEFSREVITKYREPESEHDYLDNDFDDEPEPNKKTDFSKPLSMGAVTPQVLNPPKTETTPPPKPGGKPKGEPKGKQPGQAGKKFSSSTSPTVGGTTRDNKPSDTIVGNDGGITNTIELNGKTHFTHSTPDQRDPKTKKYKKDPSERKDPGVMKQMTQGLKDPDTNFSGKDYRLNEHDKIKRVLNNEDFAKNVINNPDTAGYFTSDTKFFKHTDANGDEYYTAYNSDGTVYRSRPGYNTFEQVETGHGGKQTGKSLDDRSKAKKFYDKTLGKLFGSLHDIEERWSSPETLKEAWTSDKDLTGDGKIDFQDHITKRFLGNQKDFQIGNKLNNYYGNKLKQYDPWSKEYNDLYERSRAWNTFKSYAKALPHMMFGDVLGGLTSIYKTTTDTLRTGIRRQQGLTDNERKWQKEREVQSVNQPSQPVRRTYSSSQRGQSSITNSLDNIKLNRIKKVGIFGTDKKTFEMTGEEDSAYRKALLSAKLLEEGDEDVKNKLKQSDSNLKAFMQMEALKMMQQKDKDPLRDIIKTKLAIELLKQ